MYRQIVCLITRYLPLFVSNFGFQYQLEINQIERAMKDGTMKRNASIAKDPISPAIDPISKHRMGEVARNLIGRKQNYGTSLEQPLDPSFSNQHGTYSTRYMDAGGPIRDMK